MYIQVLKSQRKQIYLFNFFFKKRIKTKRFILFFICVYVVVALKISVEFFFFFY